MRYLSRYNILFEENIDVDYDDWDEEEIDPSKDMIYNNRFTNFLIEYDIYDKYVNNMKQRNPSIIGLNIAKKITKYIKDSIPYNEQQEIFNFTLTWSETNERSKFWENIHREWRKYIDLNESIKIDFDDWDEHEDDGNEIHVGDIVKLKNNKNSIYNSNSGSYTNTSRDIGEEFIITKINGDQRYFKCKPATINNYPEIPFDDFWFIIKNFEIVSKLNENIKWDFEDEEDDTDLIYVDMENKEEMINYIKRNVMKYGTLTRKPSYNDILGIKLDDLEVEPPIYSRDLDVISLIEDLYSDSVHIVDYENQDEIGEFELNYKNLPNVFLKEIVRVLRPVIENLLEDVKIDFDDWDEEEDEIDDKNYTFITFDDYKDWDESVYIVTNKDIIIGNEVDLYLYKNYRAIHHTDKFRELTEREKNMVINNKVYILVDGLSSNGKFIRQYFNDLPKEIQDKLI